MKNYNDKLSSHSRKGDECSESDERRKLEDFYDFLFRLEPGEKEENITRRSFTSEPVSQSKKEENQSSCTRTYNETIDSTLKDFFKLSNKVTIEDYAVNILKKESVTIRNLEKSVDKVFEDVSFKLKDGDVTFKYADGCWSCCGTPVFKVSYDEAEDGIASLTPLEKFSKDHVIEKEKDEPKEETENKNKENVKGDVEERIDPYSTYSADDLRKLFSKKNDAYEFFKLFFDINEAIVPNEKIYSAYRSAMVSYSFICDFLAFAIKKIEDKKPYDIGCPDIICKYDEDGKCTSVAFYPEEDYWIGQPYRTFEYKMADIPQKSTGLIPFYSFLETLYYKDHGLTIDLSNIKKIVLYLEK